MIKEIWGNDSNLMIYYLGSDEHAKVMKNEEWGLYWDSIKNKTDKEVWESFNGEWYGYDFFEDFEKLSFTMKNGVSKPQDMETKHFSIVSSVRRTKGVPNNAKRKIYMFGPCTIFGAYCPDSETVESHLQSLLERKGITEYEVVNMGLLSPQMSLNRLFTVDINYNDIVVISVILGGETQ